MIRGCQGPVPALPAAARQSDSQVSWGKEGKQIWLPSSGARQGGEDADGFYLICPGRWLRSIWGVSEYHLEIKRCSSCYSSRAECPPRAQQVPCPSGTSQPPAFRVLSSRAHSKVSATSSSLLRVAIPRRSLLPPGLLKGLAGDS